MTVRILLILTALLVGACTPLPAPRIAAPNAAPTPQIEISADGKIASTTLDVLTFNLEGLSWPARTGRGPSLERISQILVELDEQGKAPDVVMAQEMFSKAAIRAVHATRYANIVAGPSRTQKKRMTASEPMPRPYIIGKGEIGLHVLGAGLAILSRYPVTATQSEPFGRRCAGLDCLSNKGMLHARIAIPGVPEAVDLFDTHLNSQTASRVTPERHAAAHQRQVRELANFIDSISDPDAPHDIGGRFQHAPFRIALSAFPRSPAVRTGAPILHRKAGGVPGRHVLGRRRALDGYAGSSALLLGQARHHHADLGQRDVRRIGGQPETVGP